MSAVWRKLLLPLVPVYAGVVIAKRWLYSKGFLPQRHLGHPVISVGSLSAGGAGKTPVVLMLAQLLGKQGFEVRVLTRGYGRIGKLIVQVDPNGDADQFGDEPLMLARHLPAAKVVVGQDRYQAGMLAEENDLPGTNAVYILDDGFQHQRLAHEVEVLLVTRQDLEDVLLPAGNLREPLRSLKHADFIVLREDELGMVRSLETKLPFKLPTVLTIRRKLNLPETTLIPMRPFLFSGLARPHGFVAMLQDLGITPAATSFFRDHHRYSTADMKHLIVQARRVNANGFVTTEKDAVKLTSAMLHRLELVGPLLVASLDVELLNEASAVDMIISHLKPYLP